jgi:sulfate transport system substrate-binding protein
MSKIHRRQFVLAIASSTVVLSTAALAQAPADTLLNVSYDVSRELYKDINPAFIALHKAKTGRALTINQSHGGSSKQIGSVGWRPMW